MHSILKFSKMKIALPLPHVLLVVRGGELLDFDYLEHEVGALGLRPFFCEHNISEPVY